MRRVLLLSLFFLVLIAFSRKLENYEIDISDIHIEQSQFHELLLDFTTVENATPNIWPVEGIITSDFGWRRLRGRKEFHTGVDIAAPYGSKVVATAPGYVMFAGWIKGYGYTVIIYHGYGFVTLYAHMSAIEVERGEKVSRSRVRGYVGSTGRTTGPHLHYEVIKYGIRQNPIAFLP